MNVKKRAITLIEIMIVIFLIGIIGGVLGYSMKGSLEEGRAFKSEQGSKQIYDLLVLKVAEGNSTDDVIRNYQSYIRTMGFVNNPDKLVKDGWNQDYVVTSTKNGDFIISSTSWYNFLKGKKKMDDELIQKNYPWAFYFDELEE